MISFDTVIHNGKSIFVLDLTSAKPEEVQVATTEAHKKIAAVPPQSALILTDVTGAVYSNASSSAMKEFTSKNTPFVKASAVVGADGLRSVLLQAVASLTKREIKPCKTRQEAMDWLVSHN